MKNKKFYVSILKASPNMDTEEYLWAKRGYIEASDRDTAAFIILQRLGMNWDNVDETETGGWGGRPDDYLLCIVYKDGKFWGEIDITDGWKGKWPTEVLNHPEATKQWIKPLEEAKTTALGMGYHIAEKLRAPRDKGTATQVRR